MPRANTRADAPNRDKVLGRPRGASKPEARRDARLEFRLPRAMRERIEKAALANGQSLSEFAALTLSREAEAVLQQQHTLALSERDWKRFNELLLHAPAPSPALQAAAEAYLQSTQAQGDISSVDSQAWSEAVAARPELMHDPH